MTWISPALARCFQAALILLYVSAGSIAELERGCPCDKPELCEPITHTPAKEVVGFVVNQVPVVCCSETIILNVLLLSIVIVQNTHKRIHSFLHTLHAGQLDEV